MVSITKKGSTSRVLSYKQNIMREVERSLSCVSITLQSGCSNEFCQKGVITLLSPFLGQKGKTKQLV